MMRVYVLDMTTRSAINIYKSLLKELSNNNTFFAYRSSPIYLKIKEEFQHHRPIASKHCKQADEALFVARTYLTYLESLRHRHRIYSMYSKGEKSVKQAANIVGLELPQTTDRAAMPLTHFLDKQPQ